MITRKKFLTFNAVNLVLGFMVSFSTPSSVSAQTYISGGIYANTTWTTGGSPYIIQDTVVVFPGVSLTIQPGVVVEFDTNAMIEVRSSSIIARGTATAKIQFTSADSTGPFAGEYGGIWLNGSDSGIFTHCQFTYASAAINFYATVEIIDSCNFTSNILGVGSPSWFTIDSCYFLHDSTGIFWPSNVTINSCIFIANSIGIDQAANTIIQSSLLQKNYTHAIWLIGEDTVHNCDISDNGIGLICSSGSLIYLNEIEKNAIGVEMGNDSLICNSICSNSLYNVVCTNTYGYNAAMADNYWCTNDSLIIDAGIYDGYDNTSLGLIFFKPYDTVTCTHLPCDLSLQASTSSYEICMGQTIYLTVHVTDGHSSVSTPPLWMPGGYHGYTYSISPGTTTTYTVTITDAIGCQAKDSITIIVDSIPNVSFSGLPPAYCQNGMPIHLTGTPFGGSFSGTGVSPGGNFDPSLVYFGGSDEITYTYYSVHGCGNSSSELVDIIAPPAAPSICYVSADSSVNHDAIFWSLMGVDTAGLDSFIVYRQITTDSFAKVGILPRHDSVFIDTGTNSTIESYIYELGVEDTCGQFSLLSPTHQSIHLQSNVGTIGSSIVINLSWNFYGGNIVDYYRIYIDSGTGSGWHLLDSVPGTINAYTVLNPDLSASYMVNTAWNLACSPNSSYSHRKWHPHSGGFFENGVTYSNLVQSSIANNQNNPIIKYGIYPNPAKDEVYIIFDTPLQGTVSFCDVTGKEFFRNNIDVAQGTRLILNLSDYANGVYLLKVSSNGNTTIKKVVKM